MPACRYTSMAQSDAPFGATGSRPGKLEGSERTAEARIQAGGSGFGAFFTPTGYGTLLAEGSRSFGSNLRMMRRFLSLTGYPSF